ncbi:DUF4910 domain-containing protein [Flavobacteriaceae bacterium AU392]|nr:DUF4910 domain-containing protein [Flavobacteriaceae bacterium]RKM81264.1 DUF4910 domain-containing protein [Flavobacteriaceae bacterium AU392]
MKFIVSFLFLFIFNSFSINAQNIPFEQDKLIKHLDQELSGENAKRNLEFISRLHRMRGSEDYNKAISFISEQLKSYGLESELIKIPADGKAMYGTQKSRPAWNVEFAELWEVENKNNTWIQKNKIADWESIPLVLAQDSKSADVTAELVDVSTGTSDTDYANKNIKGKIVLTASQPGSIVPLAVKKYGAIGIVSYAQNQVTAWFKENENLIRWGHLETFSDVDMFAFMVSLKQARRFQERLKRGEKIVLDAKVIASQHAGSYDLLTAVIKGSHPQLKNEEILFTCHLDHPRPGANDNASGCVAILEVARTLNKLILNGKIERPKRSIRFLWSPEIEGTTSLLSYKPEYAEKTKFNIHMDMVGGNPDTKSIFHVSRSPQSLPNFIDDIGETFGAFVNTASYEYASGKTVEYPIVSKEGGKEALQAVLGKFSMGSDFQVFTEGSFKIPSIYLHDWPDRYIHTNYDVPANIDPTKLKRAGFIGASSAYFIANLDTNDVPSLISSLKQKTLNRVSKMLEYSKLLSTEEQENLKFYFWNYELGVFESIKPYAKINSVIENDYIQFLENLKSTIGKGVKLKSNHPKAKLVFKRNKAIKGPMSVFGYDYFTDHYNNENTPKIYNYSGIKGSGSEYAYETLNLVNNKNSVEDIRNILSMEFGPIPLEYVIEYLEALKSISIVSLKN